MKLKDRLSGVRSATGRIFKQEMKPTRLVPKVNEQTTENAWVDLYPCISLVSTNAYTQLTLFEIFKVLPFARSVPLSAASNRCRACRSRGSALVTTTSSSPLYADIRDPKSAKTLGAEESRPFSERTERRLSRMGEEPDGRMPFRAVSRSELDNVGFSRMSYRDCTAWIRHSWNDTVSPTPSTWYLAQPLTDESRYFRILLDPLVKRLNVLCERLEVFCRLFQGSKVCRGGIRSSKGVELERCLRIPSELAFHFSGCRPSPNIFTGSLQFDCLTSTEVKTRRRNAGVTS